MKTLISTSAVGAATTFGQRARAAAFSLLLAGMMAVPSTAYSATVDFEGLFDFEIVGSRFDAGETAGFVFSGDALGLTADFPGAFENAPSGSTAMVLYSASNSDPRYQPSATLNFSPGFTAAQFTFAVSPNLAQLFAPPEDPYGGDPASYPGSVQFYDGVNGGGVALLAAPIQLFYVIQSNCSAGIQICIWSPEVSRANFGVARSMVFSAAGNGFVLFDDISLTPVPLPAAAWLLLSGLAGLGFFGRRRATAN